MGARVYVAGARVHVRSYWWEPESMLQEPESMLGVMGGARVYAAGARVYASLVILVSALGPNFGLGLGLGPGLDNCMKQEDHNKMEIRGKRVPESRQYPVYGTGGWLQSGVTREIYYIQIFVEREKGWRYQDITDIRHTDFNLNISKNIPSYGGQISEAHATIVWKYSL